MLLPMVETNRYKCSLCDIFWPNISRIDGFIVKRVFNYSTVSIVCNKLISQENV